MYTYYFIINRRQIRKSRSLMQVFFGDEIYEENSKIALKCKNIRQTGMLILLNTEVKK